MNEADQREADTVQLERAALTAARQRVVSTLRGMRFTGAVGSAIPSPEAGYFSETEWLDRLANWLEIFGRVLHGVSDTTTAMADELNDLRQQRRCVREFLGLPQAVGDRA